MKMKEHYGSYGFFIGTGLGMLVGGIYVAMLGMLVGAVVGWVVGALVDAGRTEETDDSSETHSATRLSQIRENNRRAALSSAKRRLDQRGG